MKIRDMEPHVQLEVAKSLTDALSYHLDFSSNERIEKAKEIAETIRIAFETLID